MAGDIRTGLIDQVVALISDDTLSGNEKRAHLASFNVSTAEMADIKNRMADLGVAKLLAEIDQWRRETDRARPSLTVSHLEILSACFGIVRQWVTRDQYGRALDDVLTSGAVPADEVEQVLVWLRHGGFIQPDGS